MDASSVFLQLPQAWLLADQYSKPSYSSSSHASPTDDLYSTSYSGGTAEAELGSSFGASSPDLVQSVSYPGATAEADVSSAHCVSSPDLVQSGGNSMENEAWGSPSEENMPMMDRPALEYINEMLMDEALKDRTCAQQDCIAYQAIMNSLYDMLGENSPSSHIFDAKTCSNHSTPTSSIHELPKLVFPDMVTAGYVADHEQTIETDWVNQFLNSSPSTPISGSWDDGPPEGHISFVKNKDLHVEQDYQSLYVGRDMVKGPSVNKGDYDGKVNDHGKVNAHGKKAEVGNNTGKRKGKNKKKTAVSVGIDLKELLVSCAQAVSIGDGKRSMDTLQQLRKGGASPHGNGLNRVIHYFCEALDARMIGTGRHLHIATSLKDRPSADKLLKAFKSCLDFIPYLKVAHYFANQYILKVAEGASRLHIIDYGTLYGLQWPYLINALADRRGGPPKLIITGIEFPQPGPNPREGLEDIGRRLAEYAKTYNVPFEYRAIAASRWDEVDPTTPSTSGHGREVLVVNCMNRLRHVLDESVLADSTMSQRQKLLEKMRSFDPDLFVVAVLNATHNSPFFVSRFRDALHYYSSKFDMVETTWGDSPERRLMEKDCMFRDILNIVACEGVERVERPESYKQWQSRIQRVGFEPMPIMPAVMYRSKTHVLNYYHRDYTVDHDLNRWMLLSWKGRTMEAVSAWKPMSS